MDTLPVKNQIVELLDHLSPEQQEQLLIYANIIRGEPTPGTPADVWLRLMGTFQFEVGELADMGRAIEEGCENIDWESWV
jgi:hypothetical protein